VAYCNRWSESRRDRDAIKANTRNKQQPRLATYRDNSLRMQNIKNKEGGSIKGVKEGRVVYLGVGGGTMGRKGKKVRGVGEESNKTEGGRI